MSFAKYTLGALATVAIAGGNTLLAAESAAESSEPVEPVLEEVVVTATKRGSESVQSIPIAISVYTGEQLQNLGIESFTSIDLKTPGMVFTQNSGTVQPYIRGVGADFPSTGLEPPVSIYIDDVYWQHAWGSNYDLVDLSSAEVLKGPQGTLYGRNASGGAIVMTTNNPTHSDEGYISAESGNFNHVQTDVVLNKAVTDRLAVRVAARYSTQDGYLDNPVSGIDFGGFYSKTIRAKVLYDADSFSALLSLGYTENVGLVGLRQEFLSAPLCISCVLTGATPPQGNYETYQGQTTPLRSNTQDAILTLNDNLGGLTITSITAFRKSFQFSGTDEGGFADAPPGQAINIETFYIDHQTENTIQQEFRVGSHFTGPVNFVAGVNGQYSRESIDSVIAGAALGTADAIGLNDLQTHSAAVYGEIYYDFTNSLKLTVGGRFNYDKKSAENFPGGIYAAPQYDYEDSWKNFTPKVVLSYSPDQSQNYYASYNTGFKSGGFNFPSFASSPMDFLKPEKMASYEIGAKNSFLDRRIMTTAAIFLYKDDDIQVSHVTATGSDRENAASARGYGTELDAQFAATDRLNLGLGYAYLHARFTSYDNASVFVPSPTGVGLATAVENLSGTPLTRAPDDTAYASATYNFPLSDTWKGSMTGLVRYTSDYDFNAGRGGPLGLDYQKAFTLVNFNGFIGPDDNKYKIGIYVHNVFNKLYYNLVNTTALGAYRGPAPPRTFGVNISFKF